MNTSSALAPANQVIEAGWRRGKPIEDPHKIKRWGWITAKPSEHLIVVRNGRVSSRSGQGATCFKWPWDAVAIVPTSLQRLSFVADQITREKVGVQVVGLAVYRIAEPLLAYRVLNFSFPERAQQKLQETLTAMFVGATRRIVATLSVEECLQKRKAALAQQLLGEIEPVVGGYGRPEDSTAQGWGVVIDTIEVQEVRVSSANVFAAMQAPYRAELDREARSARASADQAIAERQAQCRRAAELAAMQVEEELSRQRHEIARKQLESQAQDHQRRAEIEAEQQQRALADSLTLDQRKLDNDTALIARRAELAAQSQQIKAAQQQRMLTDALAMDQRRIENEGALAKRRADITEQERAIAIAQQQKALADTLALDQRKLENEGALAQRRAAVAEQERAIKAAQQQKALDDALALEQRRLENDSTLAARNAELAQQERETAARQALRASELEAMKAQAELDAATTCADAAEARARRDKLQAQLDAELRTITLRATREEGLVRAEVELQSAGAAIRRAEAESRVELTRQLPELAGALGERIGEVKVTHIGDGNPFTALTGALGAILDIARQAGARIAATDEDSTAPGSET